MYGSMQNITKLRQLGFAKDEMEKQLRYIINNSLEGIGMIDAQHQITFVNHSLAQMLGYSCEEMIGRFYFDFMSAEAAEKAKVLLIQSINEKSGIHEFRYRKKDGQEIDTIVVCTPVFEEGVYKGSIKQVTDISLLKEKEKQILLSEEKYKMLFQHSPLPMWVCDAESLRFLAVNEAACRHYGYSSETFLSMKLTDLRLPEEHEPILAQSWQAENSALPETNVWKHQKKDGSIIRVEIKAHDISYEGKPAKLMLINDVTEKLKAEEKSQKALQQLKQLAGHLQEVRDDERKQIAREIHDELGQKLTAVKLDLAWLAKRLKEENQPLHDKVLQTIELLNDGNLAIRKILNELRTDFITRFGLEDGLRWLMLEFSKHSGIPVDINMNKPPVAYPTEVNMALYRLLQEAFTNISKHAGAKQVWADIHFHHEYIDAIVTDDGEGFNTDSPKTSSYGLLGMKERLEQINGTFEIQSSPGKGTTLHFHIPCSQAHKTSTHEKNIIGR